MRNLLPILGLIAAYTVVAKAADEERVALRLDPESGKLRFQGPTVDRARGAELAYRVGCSMVDGKDTLGVTNPIQEGIRLLEMSENFGSAKASFKLAMWKAEGRAGPIDKAAAMKAAIESYLKNMKLCLEDARDFESDKAGAEAGKREPLFWRGLSSYLDIYSTQESTRRESTVMILKSAKLGFSNAQLACGVMYLRGEIVPKNRLEAYKWLLLASANSFTSPPNDYCFEQKEFASFLTDLVEQQLTKEQIAEAQKAATEISNQAEEPKQGSRK
jgi:TPR repeat protein